MSKKNNSNGHNTNHNTDYEQKKKSKFNSSEITITFSPITALSVIILFIGLLYSYDRYKQEAICTLATTCPEEKYQWISAPEHSASAQEKYKHLDNGAFVYRHIYMEDFEKEFGVKPLYFPTIDPDIAEYLKVHNLEFRLKNSTEIDQNVVNAILTETEKYKPIVARMKEKIEDGSFIDDGSVYIRWVNDVVRYGMFAGRNFKPRDVLGIYAGVLTRQLTDLEYAWEFNYLVDVKDEKDEKVRVCIDAKYQGNYMRFANHRDKNQNGDQLYVVFNDLWHVLYLAQMPIKVHEQIFVNYGQGYWENKQKYDL